MKNVLRTEENLKTEEYEITQTEISRRPTKQIQRVII